MHILSQLRLGLFFVKKNSYRLTVGLAICGKFKKGKHITYVKDKVKQFKFPNLKIVQKLLSTPAIFDGRNIYDREEMKESGFDYFCIGIDTTKDSLELKS